ncbi:hypothetical protein GCM10010344_75450 [Streptomyces bluensis]|nr:hypothetical protein GCM10010344_75450 [Streptomyces bluensis]
MPPGLKPSSFAQNPRPAGARGSDTRSSGVFPTSADKAERLGATGVFVVGAVAVAVAVAVFVSVLVLVLVLMVVLVFVFVLMVMFVFVRECISVRSRSMNAGACVGVLVSRHGPGAAGRSDLPVGGWARQPVRSAAGERSRSASVRCERAPSVPCVLCGVRTADTDDASRS